MTAKRPYRMTPLTAEQALAELRKFAGIQFDPEVVDAFVRTSWVDGIRIRAVANPMRAPPSACVRCRRYWVNMARPRRRLGQAPPIRARECSSPGSRSA